MCVQMRLRESEIVSVYLHGIKRERTRERKGEGERASEIGREGECLVIRS